MYLQLINIQISPLHIKVKCKKIIITVVQKNINCDGNQLTDKNQFLTSLEFYR